MKRFYRILLLLINSLINSGFINKGKYLKKPTLKNYLTKAKMAEKEEHETFEKGDAGASHTFPSQAGCLKKGGFIVIKGKPCKVTIF